MATKFGTTGSDLVEGTADGDELYGYPQAADPNIDLGDTIRGFEGPDLLHGGGGHDSLEGGDDSDTLYGGTGNDTLYGGKGEDSLYGEGGNDRLIINERDFTVAGTFGLFDGGIHNDTLEVYSEFNGILVDLEAEVISWVDSGDFIQHSVVNVENVVATGPYSGTHTFRGNNFGNLACTGFQRHRVRCFDGTGGVLWEGERIPESSSLRR